MSSLIDSKIATCKSWSDFEQLVAAHEKTKDKGDLFERLTQLFLQTSTTYTSKIKQVWWCNNPYTNEFPEQVRHNLNLPEGDEGIDLICETFEGTYWSVQAKYRTDNDKALTTKELSKFLSLSFVTSDKIELGLITHTSTKPVRKQDLMGHTTELGLQNFLEMSPEQWEQIAGICANNAPLPPTARTPEPFQRAAIANAIKHFQTQKNARGKLIMPCGTGKSLMAYWMAREMNAKSIILAVPSLALVKQSLGDWTAEFLADGIRPEWLAVCSDDSVGSMKEADSTVSTVYEAGIPATTDQFKIVEFLEKTTDVPKVIFTTYQSGQVLAEACTAVGFTADLLIADEAHKTVGSSAKKFATLLSDDNILIDKRLFMTATERVIRGLGEGEVVSMDDVSVYGEVFHQMSFAEAIAEDIICDYKILTLFISEDETAHLVSERQAVEVQQGNRKVETDAHSLAVGLAVEKAFKKYGIKRAITFHSSIKRAENFASQQRELSGLVDEGIEIDYQTISSKQTAGQRSKRLHDFKSKDLALLSNARCLTEGVDIPSIDCVAFVDPKQSVVDIVQAAGRAMRRSEETGKEFGYILLPISIPSDSSFEDYVCSSDFKALRKVISALATQDERVVEELKPRTNSDKRKRFIVDADFEVAFHMKANDFIEKIQTELWTPIVRANWLPFEQAREFVRSKDFEKWDEFLAWTKSDERLVARIPSNPILTYGEQFISISDWLGTPQRRRHFLPFHEARAYVQRQKLKGQDEYSVWARTEKRPENIPADPRSKYLKNGWNGWGDWLGTGTVANYLIGYLPFNQAREYARSLSLSSGEEWIKFIDEQGIPENVPRYPNSVYAKDGWNGMKDWLGTAYLPFKESREFARSLNLKNTEEWYEWCKSGNRPANIPASPMTVYSKNGWNGMKDWLGTAYLPFEEARDFVRSLGLKNFAAWCEWCKSGGRPNNIPAGPHNTYKSKGWKDWGDFLGTGNVRPGGKWQREEGPET